MSVEILPALRSLAEGWVVKKAPSIPPQRLTSDDLDQLARASIETLAQRALGTVDGEWGSLEEMTRGWVVQRHRGATPGPLVEDDFRQCVRFVLEGLSRGRPSSQNDSISAEDQRVEDELVAFTPDSEERLPDGRRISDVLQEDPFYFAREHLALSL